MRQYDLLFSTSDTSVIVTSTVGLCLQEPCCRRETARSRVNSICKVSVELHTKDIAIDREKSHFRRPHSHLTPPHQRTPTNIGINLRLYHQKPQTVGYIFAADSIHVCASLSILKQSCLKTRASTLNDSIRKAVFNAKWPLRPFKVICFDVDEKRLGDTYSDINLGLIYELWKAATRNTLDCDKSNYSSRIVFPY